ncbi:MAG TPA: response regulator [Bryobacterales bacterium]|nr:response regulator [Bryobacterales bacterium]
MTVATKCRPAVVLLVEDDLGDQILTQEAFRGLKVPYELRIVPDGQEALDYVYRQGAYQEAPPPDLILLDLNMPRLNGQQVAEQIHADPQLRQIPIVVLTTSRRQEDVLKAYGQGVTSFISKPLDFQHFITTVQELEYLIKFALEMKGLRDRTRVTDRQIRRLARRREQLAHRAEVLFNQHMKQIEAIVWERRAELSRESAASSLSPSSAEAATREALVELAHKILQGRPAHDRSEAPEPSSEPAASAESGRHWDDPYDTARGLSELARHLDSLAGGARPAEPSAPKMDRDKLAGIGRKRRDTYERPDRGR